jgi:hypothetical protein
VRCSRFTCPETRQPCLALEQNCHFADNMRNFAAPANLRLVFFAMQRK